MQYISRKPHLAVRDHRCIFKLRLLISGWRSDTILLVALFKFGYDSMGRGASSLRALHMLIWSWAVVWSPILVCCVFAGFAPGRYVGLHRQRLGVHGLVLPVVVGMYYDHCACYQC